MLWLSFIVNWTSLIFNEEQNENIPSFQEGLAEATLKEHLRQLIFFKSFQEAQL